MKMHKNVGVNTLVMLISLIIVVSAIVLLWPMIFSNTVKVTVGQGTFDAKLAIDSTSRDNGLSGVKLVDYNQALLKVYPSVGKWSVSMKDMKTSIDILWIDYAKEKSNIIKSRVTGCILIRQYGICHPFFHFYFF